MASPTIAWVSEGVILACLSVAAATDLASQIIASEPHSGFRAKLTYTGIDVDQCAPQCISDT
jgi:hypothetical protein